MPVASGGNVPVITRVEWAEPSHPMTEHLSKAFAEASRLPALEQDALARWIQAELASERRWSESFAASQDRVAEFADEALREYCGGRTRELDPDQP